MDKGAMVDCKQEDGSGHIEYGVQSIEIEYGEHRVKLVFKGGKIKAITAALQRK